MQRQRDFDVLKHASTSRGIPAVFSLASSERVSSLCAAKEKAPRERPPQSDALRASCPPSSRSDSGVCRQSILGLTPNWAQSIAPTLRAFLRHFAAAQGAHYCASCAAKTKQVLARLEFALAFPSPVQREKVPKADEGRWLLLWRARCALTGPPRSRRGCEGQVRRMAHTMWASSTSVHGWTVGEPRSRLAHLQHRDCAQGAIAGWPFFGPPFFGQAKKGGSLAGGE